MSSRSPQSKVSLFSGIPFDLTYEHTRWFNTISEQKNYFTRMAPSYAIGNLKYIKQESGEAILPYNQQEVENTNYISFTNGRKTYYAFVTDILYINQNATKISFEIDVIQTYMFDVSFKQSFIEREHCKRWNSDGTPVINTVPENLEIGHDYNVITSQNFDKGISDPRYLLIATTEKLSGDTVGTNQNLMSGVPTSLFYYLWVVKYRNDYSQLDPIQIVNGARSIYQNIKFDEVLAYLQSEENVNKVVSMSFLPFLPFENTQTYGGDNNTLHIISKFLYPLDNGVLSRVLGNRMLSKDYNFTDFFAKANPGNRITESKLLLYPYTYATLVNNNGGSVDLYPQHFGGKNLVIKAKTVIDARNKYVYTPQLYRGTHGHLENSLIDNVGYDLPVLNDYTATYLQGNRNSRDSSTIFKTLGGGVSTAIGIGMMGSGNPLGALAVSNGLGMVGSTISGYMAQSNDIKNVPDSIAFQQSSSIFNIADMKFLPTILIKQITSENIEIIQNYFKAYGYAVHKIKYPNLRTRAHFNYIKTVGLNIVANVPQKNVDKFKAIFDTGITLWHTDDLYNYNLSNGEV